MAELHGKSLDGYDGLGHAPARSTKKTRKSRRGVPIDLAEEFPRLAVSGDDNVVTQTKDEKGGVHEASAESAPVTENLPDARSTQKPAKGRPRKGAVVTKTTGESEVERLPLEEAQSDVLVTLKSRRSRKRPDPNESTVTAEFENEVDLLDGATGASNGMGSKPEIAVRGAARRTTANSNSRAASRKSATGQVPTDAATAAGVTKVDTLETSHKGIDRLDTASAELVTTPQKATGKRKRAALDARRQPLRETNGNVSPGKREADGKITAEVKKPRAARGGLEKEPTQQSMPLGTTVLTGAKKRTMRVERDASSSEHEERARSPVDMPRSKSGRTGRKGKGEDKGVPKVEAKTADEDDREPDQRAEPQAHEKKPRNERATRATRSRKDGDENRDGSEGLVLPPPSTPPPRQKRGGGKGAKSRVRQQLPGSEDAELADCDAPGPAAQGLVAAIPLLHATTPQPAASEPSDTPRPRPTAAEEVGTEDDRETVQTSPPVLEPSPSPRKKPAPLVAPSLAVTPPHMKATTIVKRAEPDGKKPKMRIDPETGDPSRRETVRTRKLDDSNAGMKRQLFKKPAVAPTIFEEPDYDDDVGIAGADEDVDWLFAPIEPRQAPFKHSTKAESKPLQKAKGHSNTEDVDLDDLCTNIATLAHGGIKTLAGTSGGMGDAHGIDVGKQTATAASRSVKGRKRRYGEES